MKNRNLAAREAIIALMILGNKDVMQLFDEYNLALNPNIQKDAANFPSEDISVETLNSIKRKINEILEKAESTFGQGEGED